MTVTVEGAILTATGIGYFVVGCLQLYKGSIPNFLIWSGYAVAQIGLILNLK
jgi:hypothetical protein